MQELHEGWGCRRNWGCRTMAGGCRNMGEEKEGRNMGMQKYGGGDAGAWECRTNGEVES